MNKTQLLDRFGRDSDSRLLLGRILDQQQRAQQRGIPTHSAFLPGGAGHQRGLPHGRRPRRGAAVWGL